MTTDQQRAEDFFYEIVQKFATYTPDKAIQLLVAEFQAVRKDERERTLWPSQKFTN